jgi:hypothetical protein
VPAYRKDEAMNLECATKVTAKLRDFDRWFNEMTELTLDMEATEARKARSALAEMLYALDEGVRNDIKRQFPDLISDE